MVCEHVCAHFLVLLCKQLIMYLSLEINLNSRILALEFWLNEILSTCVVHGE